jgi:hypothetical protein
MNSGSTGLASLVNFIMEELRKCKERMSNRMEAANIIRTQLRGIEILMEDSLQDVSVPVEVIGLLGQARSILDKIDINAMPVSEDHQYRASQVYTGHRGRPLYDIRKEQLQFFIGNFLILKDHCYERAPVLRDQNFWVKEVVFQDMHYCIICACSIVIP